MAFVTLLTAINDDQKFGLVQIESCPSVLSANPLFSQRKGEIVFGKTRESRSDDRTFLVDI